MKVISIEYIDRIIPDMSCGTGYSEPDIFEVTFDDGTTENLMVDIWYLPLEFIREEFITSWGKKFEFDVDNLEEAFEMYVDEIAETSCPYTKEEILRKQKGE